VIGPFRRSRFDAEIFKLGLPAFGALAADPLVSLVDTAFVGRLGATELAGLAVAAAIFGVAFALFNFLAYGTTPLVAGALSRGDDQEAGRVAIAAVRIGIAAGVLGAVLLIPTADTVVWLMGAGADTVDGAADYLRVRALALPAVMLITVGHGVFRGLRNTMTPLLVTLGLNAVNLVLDPLLIFEFGWGLEGAAWATVIAQWTGALVFIALLVRERSALGATAQRPTWEDISRLLRAGSALLLRAGSLLAAFTLATAVAARVGTAEVAAHQIMFQLWIFISLMLDGLAISGQAMVATTLPKSRIDAAALSRRLLALGLVFGLVLAVTVAAVGNWSPGWFSDDAEVVAALRSVYPFLIVMQPLNALIYVGDGVVIGASDFTYLARSMLVALVGSAAFLAVVLPFGWGLAGVWWGVVVLMAIRAAALAWWHRIGPLAPARDRFPWSQEA
jgi:putative MATE family efflux protein